MNRRSVLLMLLGGQAALSQQEMFARRWAAAETYTTDVLAAMPAEHLEYTAFPGEFSFAKHLTHLAYYNVFLVSAIVREGSPSEMKTVMEPWAEPVKPAKNTLREYLQRTFQHSRKATSELTPAQLTRTDITPGEGFTSKHTGEELIWRALTHTFHHRAQAIVYLRGKGITPPLYRF